MLFVFFKARQKIRAGSPLSWVIYTVTDARDADGGTFSRRNPLFHIPLRIKHTGEKPVYVCPIKCTKS